MFRPPYAARVMAGIAVTIVEEVQKLPTTAVALPMTAVSSMLQTGMRMQQTVTTLAIKGDEVLAGMFPHTEEQPEWATFDEDAAPAPSRADRTGNGAAASANQGRFELYSMAPAADAPSSEARRQAASGGADGARPEIAEYLDYDNLTLAQLRARLRTLSVDELAALLSYENDTHGRAPFQTMLGNRITSASAK